LRLISAEGKPREVIVFHFTFVIEDFTFVIEDMQLLQ
jgi:hypothetical protein